MRSVYFAARYSRLKELIRYRVELEALGVEVTSRWLTSGVRDGAYEYSEAEWRARALIDQEDVLSADTLVSFSEAPGDGGNGGRHAELGMALALGKQVIVVGRRNPSFSACQR